MSLSIAFTRGKSDNLHASTTALFPVAPETLEEAGIGHDLVMQLILKILNFGSNYSGIELAQRLGLEFTVIEPVLETLKRTHQCEVFGGSLVGGPSYQYRITDEGRKRALLFLENSHYVGMAPVPLAQYAAYLRAHAEAAPLSVSRASVRSAFSHLVLSDKMLDQIGPAVAAGHSMFVYGPPGNGKTVIAQGIRNLLDGDIAIPHAIEVEGQIIRIYDPVNHERLDEPSTSDWLQGEKRDGRWVNCRRPMVMVGGELTLSSLDLVYATELGYYTAPIQALANGGVLVIDDFGRQNCPPRDLLNRWIVPLESRIDFLTLHTGHKFALPFNVLVVFATNIKPTELVDEAFLRRIRNKVFAESPSVEAFQEIFKRYCDQRELRYDAELVDGLVSGYLRPHQIPLRGCLPRDLIDQALAHAEYMGQSRELTRETLNAACASYFVDDNESPAM